MPYLACPPCHTLHVNALPDIPSMSYPPCHALLVIPSISFPPCQYSTWLHESAFNLSTSSCIPAPFPYSTPTQLPSNPTSGTSQLSPVDRTITETCCAHTIFQQSIRPSALTSGRWSARTGSYILRGILIHSIFTSSFRSVDVWTMDRHHIRK